MGWWIALAVVLAFILLLLLPVTVALDLRQPGNLQAKVSYFFFFMKFPRKPKEKKKPSPSKQEEEKEENPFQKLLQDHSIGEVAGLLKETLVQAGRAAGLILRHVKLSHIHFDMAVAGQDAADTAIQYGKTCAAVYAAFGALCNVVKVEKIREFSLVPDFREGEKTRFSLSVRIRASLMILLAAGVGFLLRFVINRIKQNMASGQTTQKKAVQSK